MVREEFGKLVFEGRQAGENLGIWNLKVGQVEQNEFRAKARLDAKTYLVCEQVLMGQRHATQEPLQVQVQDRDPRNQSLIIGHRVFEMAI